LNGRIITTPFFKLTVENRYPIGYPVLKSKVPDMVNLLVLNEGLLIRGSLVQVQKGEQRMKRVILSSITLFYLE
jgi:hypothetical protein